MCTLGTSWHCSHAGAWVTEGPDLGTEELVVKGGLTLPTSMHLTQLSREPSASQVGQLGSEPAAHRLAVVGYAVGQLPGQHQGGHRAQRESGSVESISSCCQSWPAALSEQVGHWVTWQEGGPEAESNGRLRLQAPSAARQVPSGLEPASSLAVASRGGNTRTCNASSNCTNTPRK